MKIHKITPISNLRVSMERRRFHPAGRGAEGVDMGALYFAAPPYLVHTVLLIPARFKGLHNIVYIIFWHNSQKEGFSLNILDNSGKLNYSMGGEFTLTCLESYESAMKMRVVALNITENAVISRIVGIWEGFIWFGFAGGMKILSDLHWRIV